MLSIAGDLGSCCWALILNRDCPVLVEDIHGWVILHVVILVQMVLQLIVGVESGLDVLHSTGKTENLVFYHPKSRPIIRRVWEDKKGTFDLEPGFSCRRTRFLQENRIVPL